MSSRSRDSAGAAADFFREGWSCLSGRMPIPAPGARPRARPAMAPVTAGRSPATTAVPGVVVVGHPRLGGGALGFTHLHRHVRQFSRLVAAEAHSQSRRRPGSDDVEHLDEPPADPGHRARRPLGGLRRGEQSRWRRQLCARHRDRPRVRNRLSHQDQRLGGHGRGRQHQGLELLALSPHPRSPHPARGGDLGRGGHRRLQPVLHHLGGEPRE